MNTMGIAPDMLRYVRIARVCGINVPEVSELGGRVREAVQLEGWADPYEQRRHWSCIV